MEAQPYTGVLAEIITAIQEAGSPPSIRRIEVTHDEMQEIFFGGAFRIAITNYYGSTSAPTFEGITTGIDGHIISLYLGGICICVGPYEPTGALADVGYEPLVDSGKGTATHTVEGENGEVYMLAGTGNPADDFVIGKNTDIEMGIAIRKRNDSTYYGDGSGVFDIDLGDNEKWVFAITIASLNKDIPNICEMYDVSLLLDTDPSNAEAGITFNLMLGNTERGKNYIWYNSGSRVIDDSATNAELSVTQMIQQYGFNFINNYVPKTVPRNKVGAPCGDFSIALEAVPRFGDGEPVIVEAMVSVNNPNAKPLVAPAPTPEPEEPVEEPEVVDPDAPTGDDIPPEETPVVPPTA